MSDQDGAFVYPFAIVDDIRSVWATCDSAKDHPFPDSDYLRKLLEIAFAASLLREELRPLEFRIGYGTAPYFDSYNGKSTAVYSRFPNPRAFSASEIRRLSPALDPELSIICVGPDSTDVPALRILGILSIATDFKQMRTGAILNCHGMSDLFNVSSNGPGALNANNGHMTFLRLRGGQVHHTHRNVFFANGIVHDHLREVEEELQQFAAQELIQEGKGNLVPKSPGWIFSLYFHFLARMLSSIVELRHGGSVVVVPDDLQGNDSRLLDRIKPKYEIQHNHIWGKQVAFIKHFLTREEALSNPLFPILPEIHRQLVADAEFVARLTCVDGAVILTDHLRVIGFGGEIQAQSPSLATVDAVDGAGRTSEVSIDGFGTRHRSMFRFVSSYDATIGFIVSQDGGLSVVKRRGSRVCLWKDVEPTLY